jgi:hypothetical protein
MDSTKPKALVGKIEQAHEGKRHRYYLRKNGSFVGYTICCDCGLTHLEEIKIRKQYLSVRVWRDEKLTQKHRGKRKVVKS